jgi:hypothetical protein
VYAQFFFSFSFKSSLSLSFNTEKKWRQFSPESERFIIR